MSVFRELIITWRGQEFRFTPTMRLMRSIEMGDISLTDIAVRTAQGRPPLSHIAFVLARILQSAGAKVTEDDAYAELIRGRQEDVTAMIGVVLQAFAPGETEAKNPDAQTGEATSPARADTSGA